jgi:hypothetical protein
MKRRVEKAGVEMLAKTVMKRVEAEEAKEAGEAVVVEEEAVEIIN